MALCCYCGQTKKLIKAHIIPRSFWEIKPDQPLKVLPGEKGTYPKKAPIGVYDTNILCAECDGWIGREFDEYAANEFLKKEPTKIFYEGERRLAGQYPNIDVKTLKRFLLSVAWRASISARPEFTQINLGPYSDKAKKALEDDEVLSSFDVCLAEYEEGEYGWLNPDMTRFSSVNTVRMYMNRFIAYIKVDQREFPRELRNCSLNTLNEVVFVYRRFFGSKEQKVLSKIAKLHKNAF